MILAKKEMWEDNLIVAGMALPAGWNGVPVLFLGVRNNVVI